MCAQIQASNRIASAGQCITRGMPKLSATAQASQQTASARQDRMCMQSALKLPCVLKGKQGLLAAVAAAASG